MIYFLTGAIGTGKTTYCVDQLMKLDQENKQHTKNGDLEKIRNIYTNISGLKITHEPLPNDWRDTPEGSVIAIDECHKIDIYQPSRKVLHDDPRIVALNESRHTGYDFYFITQAPKFLHQHIRGLVNQHFHFHNPMGMNVATVFMWRHGNTLNPDAQQAKSLAENEFIYSFKKDVQTNFKSIEDGATHTKKRKIPRKVILWALAPVVLLALIGYLLTRPATIGNLTGKSFVDKTSSDLKKAEETTTQLGQSSAGQNLDIECRKGVNVEKPECVQWFNDLTKNGGSVAGSTENTTVSYNPNKPFDDESITKTLSYTVTSKPVFSGCMLKNGRYIAYSEQGTILNEVSQSDCDRLIKHGERPYNYFKKEDTYQANNTNFSTNVVSHHLDQEQANNYVQPNLQANTTNGANNQSGFSGF